MTGTTPLTREALRQGAFDEVRRRIREEEPPKPSLRLSTSRERLPAICAQRKLEPAKLTKALRGELDWIVMKALEKDRSRRYETAGMFALDLRRHLQDEPVAALPPSLWYRTRKFARRNRTVLGFSAAVGVLAAALLGSAPSLYQEFRAGTYTGLTVHSDPRGAEVWHNGQRLGCTPYQMAGLPLGEFTYILVLTNFEAATNTTTIASRKHMNDFTFLRPLERQGAGATGVPITSGTELTAVAAQDAIILAVQGAVQVAGKDSREWRQAQTNMLLAPGDRLRTRGASRATIRLSDSTVVRFSEFTEFEVQIPGGNRFGPPSVKLKNGTLFLRGTNGIRVLTPNGVVGIRG